MIYLFYEHLRRSEHSDSHTSHHFHHDHVFPDEASQVVGRLVGRG